MSRLNVNPTLTRPFLTLTATLNLLVIKVGYSIGIGIYDTFNKRYYVNCSVTSAASRRGATVTMTAAISASYALTAGAAAATMTAANMNTNMATAMATLGVTVTLPATSTISNPTVTTSAPADTATATSSVREIALGLGLGLGGCLFFCTMITAIIYYTRQNSPTSVGAIELGKLDQTSDETRVHVGVAPGASKVTS